MKNTNEREALIARLRIGYTLHQNDTPDLDAADELMGLAADMLEADARQTGDLINLHESALAMVSARNAEIKSLTTKHEVSCSELRIANDATAILQDKLANIAQQVAVPQEPVAWMYEAGTPGGYFSKLSKERQTGNYAHPLCWQETPLYAAPQPPRVGARHE